MMSNGVKLSKSITSRKNKVQGAGRQKNVVSMATPTFPAGNANTRSA
jgi:hypothetical protein